MSTRDCSGLRFLVSSTLGGCSAKPIKYAGTTTTNNKTRVAIFMVCVWRLFFRSQDFQHCSDCNPEVRYADSACRIETTPGGFDPGAVFNGTPYPAICRDVQGL
eukprot:GHVU01017075.1.p1 GENE.GHVU01017075.1~~GHVU01017075.1.p1  ORF type:complete len:112 (-),score=2.30 GHVU01017075.1:36-347(-)